MSDYDDDDFEPLQQPSKASGVAANPSSVQPEDIRHYRASVDLRSIKLTNGASGVILRYCYPLYGATGQITTHPSVEVNAESEEVSLPNGFRTFEFAATSSAISSSFSDDPLVIEVLNRENGVERELGLLRVDLRHLLNSPERAPPGGRGLSLRVVDFTPSAYQVSARESIREIGKVRLVLSLEDFGSLDSPQAPSKHNQKNAKVSEASQGGGLEKSSGGNGGDGGSGKGSRSEILSALTPMEEERAHAVAWELEMWRRTEQAKQQAAWREEEARAMAEMEQAWLEKELEGQAAVAAKQKEITKLESRLKEALFDVEAQERRLKNGEEEQERRRMDIEKDHELQKEQMILSVRRMREQHNHQMEMAKRVTNDLKKENALTKAQMDKTAARYRELELLFRQFKLKVAKSSVGQLQLIINEREARIEQLLQEKAKAVELEERTKAQLMRCLKELGRLRRLREAEEHERLQAEKMDVQRMRVQYLAKNQQHGLRRDKLELASIKHDLQHLQHLQHGAHHYHKANPSHSFHAHHHHSFHVDTSSFEDSELGEPTSPPSHLAASSSIAGAGDALYDQNAKLARLAAERQDLLATGIYTPSHPLVKLLQEEEAAALAATT